MSISAMKQALQALDLIDKDIEWHDKSPTRKFCNQAAHFLRQAIEQAEKQKPVAFHVHKSAIEENDFKEHVNFYVGPSPSEDFVTLYTAEAEKQKTRPATREEKIVNPGVYEVAVHAIDISQKRVDETAKDKHEFECPRCGHCCQQREWVGLTDEEIAEIHGKWDAGNLWDGWNYERAIQQAVMEKNK